MLQSRVLHLSVMILFRIFSQLHSADYIYIRVKVDEEKKVDAVRVFYKGVVGNVNAVQILQFISKRFGLRSLLPCRLYS